MAAPTTAVSFLDIARKSGLLTQKQLEDVFDGDAPEDPSQCAAALVKAELITQYQAKQLLAGKFRGFFLGPYKILRSIGQGGMGVVYLAEHSALKRKVAVKVLTAEKAKDRLTLERFNREARAAAALDHPNIVHLHDISQGAGVHFLVMEFVEGTDLQSLMAQTGPLHYAQVCQYLAQAAAGLQHAHDKGIIHRDVKPANLMLTRDGRIKILDMGLARSIGDDKDNLTGLFSDGDIAGTIDFLSPEQAMNHPLDERSDIYSLGATFYALVTGHPPFNGTTAQKLMQHQLKEPATLTVKLRGRVPPALSDVIHKMMAKRPSERYQTAQDVIDALGPWLPAVTSGNIVIDPLLVSSTDNFKKQSATRDLHRVRDSASMTKLNLIDPRLLLKRPLALVGVVSGLLVLVVGLIIALTLGGGSTTEPTQQLATQPKTPVATPPVQQIASTPVVRSSGPSRSYRLDLSKQQPFTRIGSGGATGDLTYDVRLQERQRTGTGDFPAGFERSSPFGEGHEAEYAARMVDGVMAFGQRNLKRSYPHGGSMMFGPNMSFPDGKGRVRIDYRIDGVGESGCHLRFKPTSPVGSAWDVENGRLNATGGQWKTLDLDFSVRGAATGFIEVHNTSESPESWLWVKEFEVGDPVPAAAPTTPSLYRLDASRLKPFRKRIDYDTSFNGANIASELPGWQYEVYDKESDGEAAFEEVDGRKVMAIGARNGKAATQFSFQPVKLGTVTLLPGREYEARLEYMADDDASGVVHFQTLNDWKILSGVNLPATKTWKTVTFPVTRPEGKEIQFTFGTSRVCKGFLKIRSFEIVDPAATVTAMPIMHYDLSGGESFRKKYQDGLAEDGSASLHIADDVFAMCWKKTSVAEFRCEDVEGKIAVGVTNLNDDLSSQIGIHLKSLPLGLGRKYVVRVEYMTRNEAHGELAMQTRGDYRRFANLKITPTSGNWMSADMPFTPSSDTAPTLVIENQSIGEGNTLWVRKVEVFDAK